MNELMNQILYPLLVAVVTGLAGLIGYGFKYLFKYLQLKIDTLQDETDRKYLTSLMEDAEQHIHDAVVLTNETFVKELKNSNEDGILTEEDIINAYNKTLGTFKSTFGSNNIEMLDSLLPDANLWIKTKIEGFVKLNKD